MDLSPEALARATPATPDRYVDFLWAFSIVVVAVSHWSIALIHGEGGRIFVQNAVGIEWEDHYRHTINTLAPHNNRVRPERGDSMEKVRA